MPSETTLILSDGTRVVEYAWPAHGSDVGSLLLVHGLGEHARRYDHVAAAITALGLEVRAYDQRGYGRSGGARATLPHAGALVDDARWMFERLAESRRAEGDARAPFVLGHSMGGAVVARAVTGGWIAPRGMILSSPALLPRVNVAERWATSLGARLFPGLRVPNGVPRDRLSHDPAVERALASDPGVHDRVTPRAVAFMLDAGRRAVADAPRCRVPTLLQVAGDDRIVDPAAAIRFAERLPAGVGTLRVYDALYHEIYNEREPDRTAVLADLATWLRARLA
ncbi:alpha/beta hydrolase fold protein (plasmid) [Gemmatirosa kalamazoonensis]|uniref:Alpha/beta hydrolase fold protein n=1 Tax=Gemmatirosa kalamazoonensis TaxID=861299 RepID=W0RTX0_9BACT|nr:alpha/beta hydrolase [Gemmatirosa kalamazoonensis]AHG93740.1 alpha/beta hydrolase fold protein [Gemmatirosa kalamazoonensis]